MLTPQAKETLSQYSPDVDVSARFPSESLEAMRQCGLLGIGIPHEYGGNGETVSDICHEITNVSRHCVYSGIILSMHLQQVLTVVNHGSGRLKADILPEVAKNGLYIASVTSESSTGGTLLEAEVSASAANGHVSVDRDAPIVTGGEWADAFLVKVSDGDMATTKPSLIYVPRSAAQVETVDRPWNPLGMRGTSSVALHIRALVPEFYYVGGRGAFPDIVRSTFGPIAHLGWSAAWLGAASASCQTLVDAARNHKSLRTKIVDSELSLSRICRAHMLLRSCQVQLDALSRMYDPSAAGDISYQVDINALKVMAAENCFEAVDLCIEVGGLVHGYMKSDGNALERAFRDLRSASLNFSNDRLAKMNGMLIMRRGFID